MTEKDFLGASSGTGHDSAALWRGLFEGVVFFLFFLDGVDRPRAW
jgi:hypothetical protein